MPTLIAAPTKIEAAGNKPKIIREHVGRVNSSTSALSVARMTSPAGWVEPGQTPEFEEYTLVLSGMLRVTTKPARSTCRRDRRSSRMQANGCATRRLRAPITLRSVFLLFRPLPCTATRSSSIRGCFLLPCRRSTID